MHRSRELNVHGFTLVETLIVVAIIGLLMAIGIPMWLNSINRAKQTQSVADIREVASAFEARAADFRAYTAAGAKFDWPPVPVSGVDVQHLLQPTYIRKVPILDGWQRPYQYNVDVAWGASVYAIRSLGRDGNADVAKSYSPGPTAKFDCDIVYSNGAFIAWPQGVQTK